MSRLGALVIVLASPLAYADEVPDAAPSDSGATALAPADLGVQSIGASLGVAGGGRVTPGGLRVVGHYLYQLTAQDWFDGSVAFTYGSGGPGCFRDRDDNIVCDHGLADGAGVEIAANVRRFVGGRDEFWPYVRLGVGIALARYSDDELTGFALPLHAGGGVRVAVTEGVAVVVEAALDIGVGGFTRGLGLEPVLGGSVTAGAEFPL